jgi:hypothetical protein
VGDVLSDYFCTFLCCWDKLQYYTLYSMSFMFCWNFGLLLHWLVILLDLQAPSFPVFLPEREL